MVLFAAGFGLGLGTIAGLSVGPYIFERLLVPKHYSKTLGEHADKDRLVDVPEAGAPVTAEMRSLLEFTEPWTTSPDYERVSMINRVLAVMWPTLTKAIMTEVLKQVKPQLDKQVFAKYAFIEDVVLGTQSMKDNESWETWIRDKDFTIGSIPPRVGGIKSYNTSDDEVILEIPFVWGANCKFDLGVFLRLGPIRLYVPLQIANLSIKVEPRITIKPLVEDIPCVGGATVTLLRAPHVDMSIKLIKGVDLLALPIIQDGLRFAIQHVLGGMMIYPNCMSFPIMKNFGVPPPPIGALNIKLLRGENIKGGDDTYIKIQVRSGRSVTSNTVKNTMNPEYNQEFNMIVDDLQAQKLKLTVYNDDLGWNDTPLAVGTVNFGELQPSEVSVEDEFVPADFIKAPMNEQLIAVQLEKYIPKDNFAMAGVKTFTKLGSRAGSIFGRGAGDASKRQEPTVGTLYLKVMFMPFLQPTFDDEDEEEEKKKKKKPLPPRPAGRNINHDVHEKTKGVLTVHLIRCVNLHGENPTSWVRMIASDEESDVDQEHRSRQIFSENSPRWGDKFDFVMITAGSTLYFTVYDKASLTSSLVSTVNIFGKKKKEEDKDRVLGKLMIPVRDVVRNGSIKDTWVLQDTEKGAIELAMTWQTCEIPDQL